LSGTGGQAGSLDAQLSRMFKDDRVCLGKANVREVGKGSSGKTQEAQTENKTREHQKRPRVLSKICQTAMPVVVVRGKKRIRKE